LCFYPCHCVLVRTKRFNSGWLEELQKGDLKRECLEEKCSYEEAREVFEHQEATWHPAVPDSCESSPCLNGGSCLVLPASYNCLCPPPFSGLNCELGKVTSHVSFTKITSILLCSVDDHVRPETCLLENGGCEHFCDQDERGERVNCSCADGYFLNADGQNSITCGMTPVLQDPNKAKKLDPRARIVGGQECPKGECPWQVLLLYHGKGFCGGIIIKPMWILTASHCLEDTDAQFLNVVAGEHNTMVEEGTEQVIQVAQILMHERYEKKTADNDIALLRLASPVVYTPYAVPACLPTKSLAERDLWAISIHPVMSGWGRLSLHGSTARLLQRLALPRVPLQECRLHTKLNITRNMLCAGLQRGGQDACKGDSGGPLVTRYKKTWFLTGVVSWGNGCADNNMYGIYTKVSNFLDWIQHQMTRW
uniref:Coagulation factor VII n=1 Tax=Hippocampus comes TaxID=109280 RepID=A0A3Q2XLC2_HIPCM